MPTQSKRLRGDKLAPSTEPGRTVAYTRVSTEEQVTGGQSLQVQEQQLHGWAQMHGRSLDAVVIEAGVSGGLEFAKRPEGGRLMAELARGDTLVCVKLDRFSRNLFDCLGTAQEFQKRGVHLYLLDVGANDPVTGNGQSKLFLSVLGAVAEFERDRISERIRATKQRQKANNEYSGGVPRYGWRNERGPDGKVVGVVEVDEEQKQIRRMKQLRRQGMSLRQITAVLAASGVVVSYMAVRKALTAMPAPRQRGWLPGYNISRPKEP